MYIWHCFEIDMRIFYEVNQHLRVQRYVLSHYPGLFLFAITAGGVVSCGGPKNSPCTSSIVQIIFSVWSFEMVPGHFARELFRP